MPRGNQSVEILRRARNFRKNYPVAVRGEGCCLFTADGRRLLDASGGAAVVNIGHGVAEVAEAMAHQAAGLAYVHSSQFHTGPAEELASELLALAPSNFHKGGRVFFTSGGSEAAETALKLTRQYFVERGEVNRFRVIAPAAKLSRRNLGSACRFRQSTQEANVCSHAGYVGTHRSLLLLSLPFRPALSPMRSGLRRRIANHSRGGN